jgi:hypothetical protein
MSKPGSGQLARQPLVPLRQPGVGAHHVEVAGRAS